MEKQMKTSTKSEPQFWWEEKHFEIDLDYQPKNKRPRRKIVLTVHQLVLIILCTVCLHVGISLVLP